MTTTLLVHHAANRGHDHPPNSLGGLRACLEAGVDRITTNDAPRLAVSLADFKF